MHAVASQLRGEIGAIVHNEGDIAVLGHPAQDFGRPSNTVVGYVFQPKLDAGHVSAVERRGERVRKRCRTARVECRRRDQIELAGLGANATFPSSQALF
tara:strand:- start:669 stop:965 length:297 start_codon:yes stop_codon:yes gene_type:complete